MPVFPPKENKSCTGKDKSQGEPRVKYGDEYVGKQGALANDNTHRHHGGHDNPAFDIKKGKRTILLFFLANASGMFQVQSVEDKCEKYDRDSRGIQYFISQVMGGPVSTVDADA